MDILLRYEGTVDKYEGDAHWHFGAPQAQQDHRAHASRRSTCRRGCEMQPPGASRKGRAFVRIGLNCGEAVAKHGPVTH